METKDPALTKTPAIAGDETAGNITTDPVASNEQSAALAATHNDSFHDSDDEIEENTTVNKGTDTFQESIVGSEHVNEGDNEARQPDRRDQKGNSFDEGINENTVGSEAPKSEGITDMNRYTSVDNAQTRILNPDEKD
ncbi:hypothetical protein [Psychrobacter sp. LV10R520-6]|uniref:hypothetical protein n=1 Tax=Psychrobacter sp. LV10R520-6 TaxID=1415574 RepID=UPI0024CD24D1|nr:hypothetical protein [Psychrobacter sp. LV10R520-6]SNT70330.1 hypothetical protein SAMN04488491_1489 [Psychrobacter sp. LV10R520-6]